MVGSGVGDGVARARARQEVGLPLCSVAIAFLLGMVLDPKVMELKT